MTGAEIDDFVLAYEAACAQAAVTDLTAFLPPSDHPLHDAVLRELVRVDLEHGWICGRPRRLDEYQKSFPQLFQDTASLREIAFEEYRQRRQRGENPSPAEYQHRYGVDTSDWPAQREEGNDPPTARLPRERVRREDGREPAGKLLSQTPLFEELARSDPAAAAHLTQAMSSLPQVGDGFLGFELIAELGHGAFGRVYLARQPALANRYVALKIAPRIGSESQTLAQLQHTHIMPLYSVHESGPHHVICMPYLGTMTWADVLRGLPKEGAFPASGKALVALLATRTHATGSVPADALLPLRVLERLTYVDAILWLAVRLADGLAHAHERGILHRDLKPANILLTDEGQPLLLDFNLAEDTKLPLNRATAGIGGTLPYMAPEQLESFHGKLRPTDARSDIYALGVVLYQMLTGQLPFTQPFGQIQEMLPIMIADRQGRPPELRPRNPAISPAVESLVRHCLKPDPARRYQTARALQEDLQRHLDQRPLRHAPEPSLRERAAKWRRRHPRLTSVTAVTLLALLLLTGAGTLLAVWHQSLTRLQVEAGLHQIREDLKTIQALLLAPEVEQARLTEGIALGEEVLERYGVLHQPAWQESEPLQRLPTEERQRFTEDMGELLLMLARAVVRHVPPATSSTAPSKQLARAQRLNALAESCYSPDSVPQAVWRQRADLARLAGRPDEAQRWQAQAEASPPRTNRDHYLLLLDHLDRGRARETLAFLREACRQEPQSATRWLILGNAHASVGQLAAAVNCYSMSLELQPDAPWGWYNRGLAYLEQRDYPRAHADFNAFLRLRPAVADAYHNRALAKFHLSDLAGARADLTYVIDQDTARLRSWFLRAEVHKKLDDFSAARQDETEGFRRPPRDDQDWSDRGRARLTRQPEVSRAEAEAALADFDQALQLNPRSRWALQGKASALAELDRTEEAIAVLDQALVLYPEYVPARAGRGVLHARLGQRTAAHADAVASLRGDARAFTLYQVAGIYALTSRTHPDDEREAYRLLSAALMQGIGFDLVNNDRDLAPLRTKPEFKQRIDAARTLRGRQVPPSKQP